MPEPLTRQERRILEYILDYLRRHTYQPSIRDIGQRFGIKSTKTVAEHLQSLARKGYLVREGARSRALKLLHVDVGGPTVKVPVYGEVSAGKPALLDEHVEDRYAIDPRLAGAPGAFFLRVDGDSMEGMGILDGDLVLVEPVTLRDVEPGEIVAARINGKATVKRIFRKPEGIVLEPANPKYAPIWVNECQDFELLGRVTGLFRRFQRAQTKAIGG